MYTSHTSPAPGDTCVSDMYFLESFSFEVPLRRFQTADSSGFLPFRKLLFFGFLQGKVFARFPLSTRWITDVTIVTKSLSPAQGNRITLFGHS